MFLRLNCNTTHLCSIDAHCERSSSVDKISFSEHPNTFRITDPILQKSVKIHLFLQICVSLRWILSRQFFKWNCKHFANRPDSQGFSGKMSLKSGAKNQCLPDSWSICRLRVWIAPFRDLRYRAADARLRVVFCGFAGYRPIPWSAKGCPAYRASNIPPKTAENAKTPRTMRSVNARCGVFVQLCGFCQIHDPGG